MSVLVVNPAHGVAGDMLAAALAGLAGQEVLEVVAPLEGVRVGLRQVARHGIAAGLLEVEVAAPAAGLSFAHLREELGRTRLGTQGMRLALSSLQWLEEAEGRAHGHGASALHELGTLDTVVDIALVAGACERLEVDGCVVAPIGVGTATARTAHGVLPSPAPAVARLLERARLGVRFLADVAETATPTGVALLAAMTAELGQPRTELIVRDSAWGAGTADPPSRANVCQVLLAEEAMVGDEVSVIEVHVDDLTGEAVALIVAQLVEAGAFDAWAVPSVGKKGRPAQEIVALAPVALEAELVTRMHHLTGSPGVRWRRQWRSRLEPRLVAVPLETEVVHVKVTAAGAKPEFDELARAAGALGLSLAEARDRVMARYWSEYSVGC